MWYILIAKREWDGGVKVRVKIKHEKLREYMRRNNWSEKDLAEKMGVSYVTVYRVLRKKREPGNEFIAKLLNVLKGATFEELFYLDGAVTKREWEVNK
ncbi:helix-turn-helix transcriptional regulator [Geobacillus stearothermophilus]|uniref:helix-turn-helix transcriptional regulator n=1 Tax=Geobacillus stearothermophilus TaxID=1422 RepID=UPI001D0BE5EB|nr:helix-turn-helix transcriptional regulator [Geobacillus stearothermophilus]MED3785206.1 helix-turn-helix transcriptional regulator [Geobacillus stearothermophilus]MED5040839.1 helix-turn-helix transcriptional regulator [Geobacillus stearothermophilus]